MNPATIGKVLKEVAKYGPVIAEAAKQIYEHSKILFDKKSQTKTEKSEVSLVDLGKRVEQLEQNELNQAKLFSDLAEQNEKLSKLTNALATRFSISIIIASLSIILSIILLIIR